MLAISCNLLEIYCVRSICFGLLINRVKLDMARFDHLWPPTDPRLSLQWNVGNVDDLIFLKFWVEITSTLSYLRWWRQRIHGPHTRLHSHRTTTSNHIQTSPLCVWLPTRDKQIWTWNENAMNMEWTCNEHAMNMEWTWNELESLALCLSADWSLGPIQHIVKVQRS